MSGTDGFAELTLEARDPAVMERFYGEAVGLRVLTREDDRIWLDVGGHARLGLWTPGEKEFGDEGGRHVHFAFRATPGGLEALRERLVRAGAQVRGPEEHPGGDLLRGSRGQRRRGVGLLRPREALRGARGPERRRVVMPPSRSIRQDAPIAPSTPARR